MPRKTARSSCPTAVRAPGMVTAVGTARRSCGKAGKARIFTPIQDSSGESRLTASIHPLFLLALRRISSAIHDGRLISGLARHLRDLRDSLRELRLRLSLGQRYSQGKQSFPAIHQIGDFSSSHQTRLLKSSFEGVQSEGHSPLPHEIRQIEGMSGQKYRSLINGLSAQCLTLAIWKLARGQDRRQPRPYMVTGSERCVLIIGQSLVVPENFFSRTSKKC